MKTNHKLYWLAGAVALLGLLIGGYALWAGGSGPAGYVARHYERAPELDEGDTAYLSQLPPSQVRAELSGAWQPASAYADGSGVYLRYSDDVIVIFPYQSGSVIRVDDAEESYRRYHGVVGGYWGWPTGSGESQRGGGPGGGK
ncbi:MAG: DUF4247 domain-containing protein [Micromonosporaceae bacterium]